MIERLRIWWRLRTGEDDTPFDGDMPAWAISLGVNLLILAGLTLMGRYLPAHNEFLALTTTEPVEELQMEAPEEIYFSNTPEDQVGANSVGGTGAAMAMASMVSEVSQVPVPAVESAVTPLDEIKVQEDIIVATGPHFSENLTVRGAAGVGATGALGAVDRITHEILLSLEERKTLVVWLFDQSGSLAQQRKDIIGRFDKIYEELGVIEAAGNPAFRKHDKKPLLSAVLSFGQNVSFITPKPTDNLYEIKEAVESMKTDESGVERTFQAVYQAVEKFRTYRTQEPRRNVMFVVFTDEVGDDEQGLDATVGICRKYEIPVYVVGVPAPFGRSEALIKYVAPDKKFDQAPMWVPVRQGPESFQPEMVKLGFSGSGEWDEPMDSGFGPYSLTRLCYETGGIFFAVHPNRNARKAVSRDETAVLSAQMTYFFDPEIMRSYRPDYVSVKEYQKLLTENKARSALVQASQISWVNPMGRPRLNFPKVSEADFANALSDAQRAAAVLEPKVAQLYETLKSGERDRDKLTQPRWQAGFDLAMGRVLAVKVRTESYNAMLAKAKQGLKFKDPKNDTWVLQPAAEISVGSTLEKQAEQARTYLNRVAQNHKNTPWGLLAERELKEPLGWSWHEKFTNVKAPKEGMGGGGGAPNPNDDKKMMLDRPKPKAPLPKL